GIVSGIAAEFGHRVHRQTTPRRARTGAFGFLVRDPPEQRLDPVDRPPRGITDNLLGARQRPVQIGVEALYEQFVFAAECVVQTAAPETCCATEIFRTGGMQPGLPELTRSGLDDLFAVEAPWSCHAGTLTHFVTPCP